MCSPSVKFNFPAINNQPSNNHFLDASFDYKELSIALSNVNKESALDFDRINSKIIAKLPEFMKRTLLDVYNGVIHTDNFPEEWRNYLCFFISKANSNKVRPISMFSCFLLEKNNKRAPYLADRT